MQNSNKKGFTLLELLIVIGIIAILSVIVILVLNPAETLRKSRDTQRMSDLATLRTALGLYLAVTPNPDLGTTPADFCFNDPNANVNTASIIAQISYSYYGGGATCAADVAEGTDVADDGTGGTFSTTDSCVYATDAATASLVNGTGWIPVDLTSITGGSPVSNLPLDPTNTIANNSTPISTDLTYRYVCQKKSFISGKPADVFEINAVLESATYGISSTADNKSAEDGGDNSAYYEVGNSLRLLGGGVNF